MLIYTFCILHFCSGSPLLRLTRMICLHSQPFIQLRSPAVFVYRAMSRILRARLAGAQAVLEKDMCQEARETVSKLQARAISDQLKREGDTMSTDDAVVITETLVKIRFPDHIRDSLLSSIVCSDAKRRKQQDFTKFIVSWGASMWTTLLATSVADTAKMEALALHLILMGCVNPTEPTTKLASSLFMIATMGYRKASELSAFHKGQFKAMHAAMENMVRSGATSCGAYISKLPKSADDCAAMFPDVFGRIFSTDPPVEPRVDVSEVMRLDASYNCRSSCETRPMVSSQLATSGQAESSQVMQAAMAMMQSMHHMMMGAGMGRSAWHGRCRQHRHHVELAETHELAEAVALVGGFAMRWFFA